MDVHFGFLQELLKCATRSPLFSPLMSVVVASNTFQLAQWCIAPNILA